MWWGLLVFALLVYFGIYAFLQLIKPEQATIFKSQSLPAHYTSSFQQQYQELNFRTKNEGLLNALLFRVANAKGVICFWKGNGGTLKNWGAVAPLF